MSVPPELGAVHYAILTALRGGRLSTFNLAKQLGLSFAAARASAHRLRHRELISLCGALDSFGQPTWELTATGRAAITDATTPNRQAAGD